jgi:hypothetical protein
LGVHGKHTRAGGRLEWNQRRKWAGVEHHQLRNDELRNDRHRGDRLDHGRGDHRTTGHGQLGELGLVHRVDGIERFERLSGIERLFRFGFERLNRIEWELGQHRRSRRHDSRERAAGTFGRLANAQHAGNGQGRQR